MAALTATPSTMRVSGTLRVPGDKSISHRALIFGALSQGRARVRNILQSADVQSTAQVLREMGIAIDPLSDSVTLTGNGLQGLRQPQSSLDCGNSGTTARLMSGVIAGHPISARLIGDASLSRRPMRRVSDPLTQMGARFDFESGDGLPMTIHGGQLSSIHWHSLSASAQIKSAILLAGLVGHVSVSVTEPERSRDHTERMLSAFGVDVLVDGTTVSILAVHKVGDVDIDVPADPSSAAFFAALAAASSSGSLTLSDVCLNPTRIGFLDALIQMGAAITYENRRTVAGEPVGDVVVNSAPLRAISIEGPDVPAMVDELPLLACLATKAEGETIIRGAEELRVKESDRIAVVVNNLRTLGAEVDELPDGMVIRGTDRPLRGTIQAHADHRIAMAFGILGALPGNEITVDDPACVAVSYPHFWDDLVRVTS